MAERPIVAELRAVDAALSPLAPSRELDSRIDALLAGRAPRVAQRRVAFAGLGVCAAAAAVALWLGRSEPQAIAAAPAAPSAIPATPSVSPPLPPPTSSTTREQPTPVEAAAPDALAFAEGTVAVPAPTAPTVRSRAVATPAAPVELVASAEPRARGAVDGARTPRAALVAGPAVGDADGALEAALAAVRADKARGDLRGAVVRIDALLASGVTSRVELALRIERARVLDRLGEHAAACAGLDGVAGDDAHDARVRLACP
ncbi:MAG: hypothetical protein HYS27_02270 [Deltaproteobacteria bacterium]|nr:hypothetical protein [Deltaproteobacteria bacterium]